MAAALGQDHAGQLPKFHPHELFPSSAPPQWRGELEKGMEFYGFPSFSPFFNQVSV